MCYNAGPVVVLHSPIPQRGDIAVSVSVYPCVTMQGLWYLPMCCDAGPVVVLHSLIPQRGDIGHCCEGVCLPMCYNAGLAFVLQVPFPNHFLSVEMLLSVYLSTRCDVSMCYNAGLVMYVHVLQCRACSVCPCVTMQGL